MFIEARLVRGRKFLLLKFWKQLDRLLKCRLVRMWVGLPNYKPSAAVKQLKMASFEHLRLKNFDIYFEKMGFFHAKQNATLLPLCAVVA